VTDQYDDDIPFGLPADHGDRHGRTVEIWLSSVSTIYEVCRKCRYESGYLARYIQVDGRVAIRWVCSYCEDYGTAGELPRAVLTRYDLDLDQLPIRVNRYNPERRTDACVVCGDNRGSEHHHWAPVALFPDWPYTLTLPLCQRHHREWHTIRREHGLQWPHEL
jgi:hypothetical protein